MAYDFDEIPDDVPPEALSGAAKAMRSDNPTEVIEKLPKADVLSILRYIFDVPDHYVGDTERNVSTKELRHMAHVAVALREEIGEETDGVPVDEETEDND